MGIKDRKLATHAIRYELTQEMIGHVTQTIKEEVSGLLVSPSIFFPLFYPSGTLWVSRTLEIIFTERDSIPGVPFVSLNMVYNSR